MNENLDLTELLKDCPKGTKFYSSYLGRDVFFIGIHNNYIECEYPSKIDSPFNSTIQFRKEGSFFKEGECMFFPSKDQRDWSKWQRPFKNGDIIVSAFGNIAIFSHSKKNDKGRNIVYYHCLYSQGLVCKFKAGINCGIGYVEDCKLATEYERELMMDAVRKNGYRWNDETKTLEKLIVPKFKVGDIIRKKDGTKECVITKISGDSYDYVTSKTYNSPCFIKRERGYFPIDRQDDYELIPDKFDPKFFKPFDKALVRIDSDDNWYAVFFSHIEDLNGEKFVTTAGMCYKQMIPYNENTKHLLGTNNEAPEFYKCWED